LRFILSRKTKHRRLQKAQAAVLFSELLIEDK